MPWAGACLLAEKIRDHEITTQRQEQIEAIQYQKDLEAVGNDAVLSC